MVHASGPASLSMCVPQLLQRLRQLNRLMEHSKKKKIAFHFELGRDAVDLRLL